MRQIKYILAVILISSALLSEDKFLSTETIFSRYLVSRNPKICESIIASEDTVFSLFCKAEMAENSNEKIQLFTNFINLKPKLGVAEAFLGRGISYSQLEVNDTAMTDLNKSIELNPKEPFAYYFRAYLKFSSNNYKEAIQDFSKTIEIDSKFYLALNLRGQSYFEINEYEKAIQDLNASLAINKNNEQAYFLLGMTYYKMNNYTKALENFEIVSKNGKSFKKYSDEKIESINQELKKNR